jgi:hypothetical protein
MRGSVTAAASYGGKRVQTHYFHTNSEWLRGNLDAARALVSAAGPLARRAEDRTADGRYLLRDVPYDLVATFLSTYRFHERSPENDADLIIGYINKRAQAGSLRQWNIAVVGNPVVDDRTLAFAPGVTVGRITRARLALSNPGPDFADIKTLMSRPDAAIDLSGDTAKLPEKAIMDLRADQLPNHGLLVLYPIDKTSAPSPSKKLREPLNAEEHVIGVGLVFPQPNGNDSTAVKYISADLSGVEIEEEDYSLLDGEDV